MIIIVDCMGGDNAPREVVRGAYFASLEYNASFVLVGDRAAIEQVAAEKRFVHECGAASACRGQGRRGGVHRKHGRAFYRRYAYRP